MIDLDIIELAERAIPTKEHWLTSWCAAHTAHLAALAAVDTDPNAPALEAAMRLADKKQRIYLASLRAAAAEVSE